VLSDNNRSIGLLQNLTNTKFRTTKKPHISVKL